MKGESMQSIITALIGAVLGGGAMLWILLFLHKRAESLTPPSSQRESARWCDCGADCC